MTYRRPPRRYTPEFIENGRHRYEETKEPVDSIIADFGMHTSTFYRMVRRLGWKKRLNNTPRDMPADLRILVDAERAVQADAAARVAAATLPPDDVAAQPGRMARGEPAPATVADRLERAIERALAGVELTHATLGPQAQPSADAERTARTLERLTDALSKVRRLRAPDGAIRSSDDYDDLPKDMDEFRHALARRMEAFVRSRTGGGLSQAGDGSGAAEA